LFITAQGRRPCLPPHRYRTRWLAALAAVLAVAGLTTVTAGSPAAARTANPPFATPYYYPSVFGDTYFNTVGPDGDILATTDDTHGAYDGCSIGRDIAIIRMVGTQPAHLGPKTVNCMTTFGVLGGGKSPDGCSWKSGGITNIAGVVYLAVARQLGACSRGRQASGLQPSYNASIIRSTDGGRTWVNAAGVRSRFGAAPAYRPKLHRYAAMFPGRGFSAPFFIQYGPHNTRTVDGADQYLYSVSNDGYAYNGNWLHLARVPIDEVQDRRAWQFYHGRVGGAGNRWTSANAGATRVLQVRHGISQPAIQYLPAFHRYVLVTFTYSRARRDFPTRSQTPYTRVRIYSSPKPWGPWKNVLDDRAQRSLWCIHTCRVVRVPSSRAMTIGGRNDWLGLYDPTLVQKLLFTRAQRAQALVVSGDFRNENRYRGQNLYRLQAIPFNLAAVMRR
jgi:hypothetical protein